jgi:threonine dehydrogenase-like Zn-dependent dehydrogenase
MNIIKQSKHLFYHPYLSVDVVWHNLHEEIAGFYITFVCVRVDVNIAVTHEFPMSQFEKAFEVLFSGEACKIMIDPHC